MVEVERLVATMSSNSPRDLTIDICLNQAHNYVPNVAMSGKAYLWPLYFIMPEQMLLGSSGQVMTLCRYLQKYDISQICQPWLLEMA